MLDTLVVCGAHPRVASFIAEMERNSGVKFHEAQVALARQWIGTPSAGVKTQDKIDIKVPQPESEGGLGTEESKTKTEAVPVPASAEAARQVIERFEHGADNIRGDEDVSDTVAQHMLRDKTSLLEEKWLGTEEEERNAYV